MKIKYFTLAATMLLATTSLTSIATVNASPVLEDQTEATRAATKKITIDPFYNTSMVIVGQTPAGGTVRVDLSSGGKVLGSTFVTSIFFFQTANLGINTPGTVFELTAYDSYGRVVEKSSYVTQMDPTLKVPTINRYSEGMPFVHGTISDKSVAAVLFVDGERVSQTFIANSQFTFFDTAKLKLKKGQKIEVAGMVSNGVLGPKASIIVE